MPLPDVTAWLSLGEYGALLASEVLSMEDAFRIVRKRGLYMQEAVPEGIASMSNDGMTISYAESGSRSAMYTQASISPAAYAFLLNAGLIGGAIPRARRL